MNPFWRRYWGALRRVIPGCIGQSQAVAFNMFLAFFPMMLLVLGMVARFGRMRGAILAIIGHLSPVLPPGTERLLLIFLSRSGAHTWQWVSLGLGGTLLAGTQMMRLLIDGFQMVYNEPRRVRFVNYNLRAMLLLVTTIAPLLVTADLIVFGRQIRNWMVHRSPEPGFVSAIWAVLYVFVTLVLAMIVLSVVYRIGRPAVGSWVAVLPGAALGTLLWWLVSASLGLYVRHVPYGAIYEGTADVIGMMLWMQLTATVILIGAAYNAECESASSTQAELQ